MPTNRSYGDACTIARALDVVGERWALLVVRELLLGPRRFTDVRRGLPGASTNLVADRLRELEAHDVVQRRQLPAPAASWVYELTPRGQKLEAVLDALGGWGGDLPRPPEPFALSATSVLLYLRGAGRLEGAATYRIELRTDPRTAADVWTVRAQAGRLQVTQGGPDHADAGLRTDPHTLNDLLSGATTIDALTDDEVRGDRAVLRRLLHSVRRPPGP
jgi:DNA-binding HxlR family transcriptional regulator